MKKNKLVLVRGVPGSGKSTYAKTLAKQGFKHFEADMFFIKNNKYLFDSSEIKQAHIWCQINTRKALTQGYNVVVSNTFTRLWEMQPYLDIAKELGVDVEVIRMKNRFKNIHNVPKNVVDEMEIRFQDFDGEFEGVKK